MHPRVMQAPRWVYEIRDLGGCPVYVGVTHDPAARWYQHKCGARSGTARINVLLRAYGADAFVFEAVEYHESATAALDAEAARIAKYLAGAVQIVNGRGGSRKERITTLEEEEMFLQKYDALGLERVVSYRRKKENA